MQVSDYYCVDFFITERYRIDIAKHIRMRL